MTARKESLKFADLVERSGIDLDDIARINKVNCWQGFYKDADGEAHLVDMVGVQLTPNWSDGPAWPVVAQAAPVKLQKPPNKGQNEAGRWRAAVILPDVQIGYRRLRSATGEWFMDPFHDEKAMACALQIVAEVHPELVVLLGDFLDLPAQSKYIQEQSWASTTQDALDRGHRFLAEIRALVPDAEIVVLEGNHDLRLPRSIQVNAAASFGLQRANLPASWPVLTLPHLLRFEELAVQYVEGYPANEFWINDNLVCIHGRLTGNATRSAASRVVDDERVSTIFGHVHTVEIRHKTRRVRDGRKHSFAASPGCLCRIDGAVPSVKSGLDQLGRPLVSYENWQQGVGVVTFEPGNGRFDLEMVNIFDGSAMFRGRSFTVPLPSTTTVGG